MTAADDQGPSHEVPTASEQAARTSKKQALKEAWDELSPEQQEYVMTVGIDLGRRLLGKRPWSKDRKLKRQRQQAIRSELTVTFRMARRLVEELNRDGPLDLPSLAARLDAGSPKDRDFKRALKVAFKENRIVESTRGLQARNEEYVVERNPSLRESGVIEPMAGAIVDQLERNGLMALDDLESSIQPRARSRSAEKAAFAAALERDLSRGQIEWLAPRIYGVKVERLEEYEASGKRAEQSSV